MSLQTRLTADQAQHGDGPQRAARGTEALLVATARSGEAPVALQTMAGETLVGRLVGQLAAAGVVGVTVVARPESSADLERALEASPVRVRVERSPSAAGDLRAAASAARAASDGLVVGLADVITQREALVGLVTDPRLGTAILSDDDYADRPAFGVRSRRGRVVSAGSAHHVVQSPNHRFLGFVKVLPADLGALADAADELAGLEPATDEGTDVVALLLVGLVRSGAVIGNSFLRGMYWARPLDPASVERAAGEIGLYDEDRLLLESAVKPGDGFFTTFFVSPYSKFIARWAAHRGFTPNGVTTVSLVLGILAAAGFATGERWGLVAGAVVLQAAFTTDCVDGQLARYTRTFSKLGGWLDSTFDRAKEYIVYAGLAIGAGRHGDAAWLLAGAAVTLQTARHMMEFSWASTMHQQMGADEQPPLAEPHDAAGLRALAVTPDAPRPARSGLRRAVARWSSLDDHPRAIWFKRIAAFPIGERFAAISLLAAFTSPRTTLVVMLAIGAVAAAYAVTGRLLRSLAA